MFLKLQAAVSLFTCGCLLSVAAEPSIGVLVTNGVVQIDGAAVRGNSTLFQGSVIRTGNTSSDLQFEDGSRLVLQQDSAARIYRNYSVVEQGIAMQRGSTGHALVADGLTVKSLSSTGAVLVGVRDASHVEMAAQDGPAEVRNAAGSLIARLEPGKPLTFTIQSAAGSAAGENSSVTVHGILRQQPDGHYAITDSATNVTYELQGSGLDQLVGASVEVTGTVVGVASAGGTSTVAVSQVRSVSAVEASNGPAAQGGRPAPAVIQPIWTGKSIIFAIGVAAGGTLLGLAAAGDLSSSSPNVSTP